SAELVEQSEELQVANEELIAQTEELEQARLIADDANRAKSQFLATMSHELRTPLNAIAGYAQLIELGVHGPVTDAQKVALDRIQRSERHLLSLVNDVLNFAKMEAGRLEYHIDKLVLADVVTSTTQMVEPQIRAKGLEYNVRITHGLAVNADSEKLQQILLNLLSNAIKFSQPGGGVWVDTAQRLDERPNVVYVRVCDNGIGIPRDKQEAIFDPFVQIDRDRTWPAEGTGLGLAISRDLARGMGGDLRVRSTPGQGSTFTVTLPMVAL
ncbi:MAG TPA: ATP-binding protein, partial [Gemmatimonadaceae bacterium]